MAPPWAPHLPEDILLQIFAALDVPDLACAGSVCSSWHGAYTSLCNLGRWKQQQTPCLLYTAKSRGQSAACLYSLAEKKAYTLALPDPPIRSRYLIGSAYGWIITADESSELDLLNPITGDQIALPSVTTMDHVKPIYNKNGVVKKYEVWRHNDNPSKIRVFGLRELRKSFFVKAFLSSDPSTGDYIVVLIHRFLSQLSFARSGDDHWTLLHPHEFVADCVFKVGILYVLTELQEIQAFDFSGPAVEQKLILDRIEIYYRYVRMYIVQAPCGDLLQIRVAYDHSASQPELDSMEEDEYFSEDDGLPCPAYSTSFEVCRVDLAARKRVKISSLDESVLFVGLGQSLCLHAEVYPQLKANHVYFTDDDGFMFLGANDRRRNIGVVSLSNTNIIENITSPQIWSNWPNPLWITPNPQKMNSAMGGSTEEVQAPSTSCRTFGFQHGWSVALLFLVFLLYVVAVSF
ncbi:unnamed protein product [Urochloa decumbens]|uniref:F-box domain-containing protein n=1 Tax=Urochloa decumbens TaxID=240449 RepID=A0ABC9E1B5_9POAL